MKRFKENAMVYLIGSVGYSGIEILWRGFTHWTMAVTGGICFLLLYRLNFRCRKEHWAMKCLKGSAIITSVEFVVGCIVNRQLHWNVWDYSGSFGNILGQICPLYSMLWFFLCIPVFKLATGLKKNYFSKFPAAFDKNSRKAKSFTAVLRSEKPAARFRCGIKAETGAFGPGKFPLRFLKAQKARRLPKQEPFDTLRDAEGKSLT